MPAAIPYLGRDPRRGRGGGHPGDRGAYQAHLRPRGSAPSPYRAGGKGPLCGLRIDGYALHRRAGGAARDERRPENNPMAGDQTTRARTRPRASAGSGFRHGPGARRDESRTPAKAQVAIDHDLIAISQSSWRRPPHRDRVRSATASGTGGAPRQAGRRSETRRLRAVRGARRPSRGGAPDHSRTGVVTSPMSHPPIWAPSRATAPRLRSQRVRAARGRSSSSSDEGPEPVPGRAPA